MVLAAFLLAVLSGLTFGLPVAKAVNDNSPSVYNPLSYNVVYDLKAIYGDSDGDGVLTESEYSSFDVSSLLDGKVVDGFAFLGFNPVDENDMIFYLFSKNDFRYENGNVFKYQLMYRNSSSVNSDSSGYLNDFIKTSYASYINSYAVDSGWFYKFNVSSYVPDVSDGRMRISADSFIVYGSDGSDFLRRNVSGELFYTGYGLQNSSTYFEENTHVISGVVDMVLATTKQVTDVTSRLFFVPMSTESHVEEALEIPYFFFNFDDDFKPDQIRSVTWECQVADYVQTHFYQDRYGSSDVPYNGWSGIYQGRMDDSQSSVRFADRSYDNVTTGNEVTLIDYSDSVVSDGFRRVSGTADGSVSKVVQTDTLEGWFGHSAVIRSYFVPSIVDMSSYSTDLAGDDFALIRDFLDADDHQNYRWAYALQNQDWVRKVTSNNKLVHVSYRADPRPTDYLWSTVTECHEPSSIVTLSMKVVQDNRDFDIRVMNNPQSVRKVYMVGLDAPSIGDFLANDITFFFDENPWIWAVVVFGILAFLVILSVFVKPISKVLAFLLRFLIVLVYFPFWLIRAFICLVEKKRVPDLWFWRKN